MSLRATAKSELRTFCEYFRILAGAASDPSPSGAALRVKKQRPYEKMMCGRGAACCALRREDINVLFGSLDYDFAVALT
jgi:hypothetical protein